MCKHLMTRVARAARLRWERGVIARITSTHDAEAVASILGGSLDRRNVTALGERLHAVGWKQHRPYESGEWSWWSGVAGVWVTEGQGGRVRVEAGPPF